MPENVFFTADTHFADNGVLVYRHRPFVNVDEMNAEIVRLWNETIGPNDTVYHLGDVAVTDEALREFVPQLNGKINLICGNHEIDRDQDLLQKLFSQDEGNSISEIPYTISTAESSLYLCHYPKQRVLAEGKFTVVGHIHDLWKVARRMLNVGVDAWHMRPVHISVVHQHMKAEADGRWDANVYPDAPLSWQFCQTSKILRRPEEPTMKILRRQAECEAAKLAGEA